MNLSLERNGAVDPSDMQAGQILDGRYELEEPIGSGAMATVWRAKHLTLRQPVAIKFVHVPTTNERLRERFVREARVAAAVRHRNVIDITDFGTADGQPYMVMELLEGESLDHRLVRGETMDLPEVIRLVARVLSGLGAVHDAGIVHRDLKPENIFMARDADGEYPKLMDFGVSRAVQGGGELKSVLPTVENLIVGTPQYMSPEQARGLGSVDHRSDLFGVGVLLYELLSGELPFDAEAPGDVLIKVASQEPEPLRTVRPDLAGPLTDVVEKAMTKDPARRFSTAREMRKALLEAAARTAATLAASGSRRGLDTQPDLATLAPADLYAAIGDAFEPGDSNIIELTEADLIEIHASPRHRAKSGSGFEGAREPEVDRNRPTDPAPPLVSQRHVPTVVQPQGAPTPRRRWPWAAGGALVIAAMGAVLWLGTLDPSAAAEPVAQPPRGSQAPPTEGPPTGGSDARLGPAPSEQAPTEPAPTETAPTAAEEARTTTEAPATARDDVVTVRLEGVPEGAVVWVDGERSPGGLITLSRADEATPIEVRQPGHRPWRVRHRTDHGAVYQVELTPLRRAPNRPAEERRPPRRPPSAERGLFSDPGF